MLWMVAIPVYHSKEAVTELISPSCDKQKGEGDVTFVLIQLVSQTHPEVCLSALLGDSKNQSELPMELDHHSHCEK